MDIISANIPKSIKGYNEHHYVPVSVLDRFKNPHGKLFYFNKNNPNAQIISRNPRKIFVQRNLYTYLNTDGKHDKSVEFDCFQNLDTKIAPIMTKIIENVRNDTLPKLTATERDIWDEFYLVQGFRCPEFLKGDNLTKWSEQHYEQIKNSVYDLLGDTLKKKLDSEGYKQQLITEVKITQFKERAQLQSKAILKKRGLYFYKINNHRRSFIIGSAPLVRCLTGSDGHLTYPDTQLWFPISHDVAVSMGNYRDHELKIQINNEAEKKFVFDINNKIFEQSNEIAGYSLHQIQSITKKFKKSRVSK